MHGLENIRDLPAIKVQKLDLPFIEHAFLTRQGGVSEGVFQSLNVSFDVGDEPSSVIHNRALIARGFGLKTDQFFFLRQVHGNQVVLANGKSAAAPGADAAITDGRHIALAVKTADCVPILLCDPQRPAIGIVHAGWRGTALNIAGATVAEMEKHFGTERENLLAAVGPAIRGCCYEVDDKVLSALTPWVDTRLKKKGEKFYIDLPRINLKQLIASGLKEENIAVINYCTACEAALFFSHRRDQGLTGRQLSFIMIK